MQQVSLVLQHLLLLFSWVIPVQLIRTLQLIWYLLFKCRMSWICRKRAALCQRARTWECLPKLGPAERLALTPRVVWPSAVPPGSKPCLSSTPLLSLPRRAHPKSSTSTPYPKLAPCPRASLGGSSWPRIGRLGDRWVVERGIQVGLCVLCPECSCSHFLSSFTFFFFFLSLGDCLCAVGAPWSLNHQPFM